jgi:hypothetical protein
LLASDYEHYCGTDARETCKIGIACPAVETRGSLAEVSCRLL